MWLDEDAGGDVAERLLESYLNEPDDEIMTLLQPEGGSKRKRSRTPESMAFVVGTGWIPLDSPVVV